MTPFEEIHEAARLVRLRDQDGRDELADSLDDQASYWSAQPPERFGEYETLLLAKLVRRIIAEAAKTDQAENPPNDIHGYFGPSYTRYFVAPRSLLQSMPQAWQHRFTALLAEYGAAFDHLLLTTGYNVEAGKWCCLSDLTDADMERLGITSGCDPLDKGLGHECSPLGPDACTYFDRLGDEIDQHTACVFVPGSDPVPHYDRGRTHVQRADELAEADRG